MRRSTRRTAAASVLVSLALLAGCTSAADDPAPAAAPTSAGSEASASPEAPASGTGTPRHSTERPELDAAESTPVEDSVYPQVGDPGVDALQYDLDLAWAPQTRTLTAVETLTFRATGDAGRFQLDLSSALDVSSVTVDGADVSYDHVGKDLVVQAPVSADDRYTLEVRYAGTPRPVAAPTTRADFSTLGWTITDKDEIWTMQEPFGAYSWYAVNDQPADKALYSFTITAPSPMVGVANGELVSRQDAGGTTVTRWVLDEPAASYLTTIAVGDLQMTRDRSSSGVPITYWTPRSAPSSVRGLRATPKSLDWLEKRLGPYPFSTLGILLVDSRSGMETQTMITLGRTDYTTSPEVIVHELVHQWWGDEITPTDWRDVWMSEGMAMYIQGIYQADKAGQSIDALMAYWATLEPKMRRESGPPADYDPATFGESNIYYGPALMWHELRRKIGDEKFWRIVRTWPTVNPDGNASGEELIDWLNEQTGSDLSDFYDAWLLGPTSPPRASP